MAHRSIEEVFQTIAPSRRRGIPNPEPIGVGFAGKTGDVNSSVSQVAQEITQLRAAYQQQQDLIKANTQAVQNNTSAKGSTSAAGTVGHVASSLFGVALGFLSPVVSGLMGLFGGGSSTPAALPVYTPPPPVSIDGLLRAPTTGSAGASNSQYSNSETNNFLSSRSVSNNSVSSQSESNNSQSTSSQTSYSPQITVNVSAMDSQSFMDRSGDIANAVREAMLNNHPINRVVTDL